MLIMFWDAHCLMLNHFLRKKILYSLHIYMSKFDFILFKASTSFKLQVIILLVVELC